MKKEREKNIERKLRDMTKDAGGMCLKMVIIHTMGLPDRVCLFPRGRVLFVETKSTGDVPRKIQNYMHAKLRSLGFRVEVIDNSKKLKEVINEYAQ